MLEILISGNDFFDSSTNEFINVKPTVIQLEHSLISLKKWESRWKVPFIGKEDLTVPEFLDYVQCMTLNKHVDPLVYRLIQPETVKQILDYIGDPMTATTITYPPGYKRKSKKEIVTAEILYYWMITLNIPIECEKWHLNQLMTLIEVCAIKNSPPKKMGKREVSERNAALNAARRAKYHTKG